MSIIASARTFATTTFTTGTATVGAVAALAETAQLHANHLRDETRVELEARQKKSHFIATAKAQNKVTDALLSIQERMTDPKFAAMHALVCAEWDEVKPSFTVVHAA